MTRIYCSGCGEALRGAEDEASLGARNDQLDRSVSDDVSRDPDRERLLKIRRSICSHLELNGVGVAEGATAMLDLVALLLSSPVDGEAAKCLDGAIDHLRRFHAYYCQTTPRGAAR